MDYDVRGSGMSAQEGSDGYPVQIAEVTSGTLKLNEKDLEMILMQPQLEDMPVMVLSCAGIFRSGRSFLLNLLIRYLNQGCSQSWMDDEECIVKGFESQPGIDRLTTGIWIWSKVFIIGPFGRKVLILFAYMRCHDKSHVVWQFGVVLMDIQGSQDPYSSTKENAAIVALSTLLCSVQIYNVKSDINEADLQFLQLFVKYGAAIKRDNEKPFQTLLFLIRDWKNPRESSFGRDGGIQHLTKIMTISPNQSQENQDLRKSIGEMFANIKCFLMPRPGDEVCEGESNGQIRDIAPRFQVQMKDLADFLFSSEITEAKKIDGKSITCGSLVDYFKDYVRTINEEGNMVESTSINEAHALAHNHQSYTDVMQRFVADVDKLCENYQENLIDFLEYRKMQALAEFNEKCRLNPSAQYGNLEDEMKDDINGKMLNYYAKNSLIEAQARSNNWKHFQEAMTSFETGMNEVCSSYWKESALKSKFMEQKRLALEYFINFGKRIGTSYSEYIQELEVHIAKKYPVYTLIMAQKGACLHALRVYAQKMDEKYTTYQKPIGDYRRNHAEAKQKALAAYESLNVGKISRQNLQHMEQKMELKKKECEQLNYQKTKIAENQNNVAHDAALVSYRDKMQRGFLIRFGFEDLHYRTSTNAEKMYDDTADQGFPSYQKNKMSLARSIHTLNMDFQSRRGFWIWFRKNMLGYTIEEVSIPSHLLKSRAR